MPDASPRVCSRCRGTVPPGERCPCRPAWSSSERGKRGSTRRSRKLRRRVLAEEPICAIPGCGRLSEVDDHIVGWAQRGSMTEAEWDARTNHQGLCRQHSDEKTARESRMARPDYATER